MVTGQLIGGSSRTLPWPLREEVFEDQRSLASVERAAAAKADDLTVVLGWRRFDLH
jgi:hypothetical protein